MLAALVGFGAVVAAFAAWVLWSHGAFTTPGSAIGDHAPAVTSPICAGRECGVTVVLFGASLLSSGEWRDALEKRLTACHGGPVDLRIVAKAGASSDWARAQIERLFPADAVIVDFAVNDASLWRGMPLMRSRANHIEIIDAAKANGAAVLLATMSPAFGLKAAARPGRGAYDDLYRDLAASEGVGLIDDAPRWRAKGDAWLRASIPDSLHPTNAAMAEITLPSFERALSALICPR